MKYKLNNAAEHWLEVVTQSTIGPTDNSGRRG